MISGLAGWRLMCFWRASEAGTSIIKQHKNVSSSPEKVCHTLQRETARKLEKSSLSSLHSGAAFVSSTVRASGALFDRQARQKIRPVVHIWSSKVMVPPGAGLPAVRVVSAGLPPRPATPTLPTAPFFCRRNSLRPQHRP